ncbi:GspE/PulE family protein [Rhizobium sp. PP-CC-3G-465]|uniref:GspE/PulE family protein n=1 Tax=Rhizobium sp. PP-CC-3G-465 TaxID=2135648 RepID=UPI0010439D38|nr:general secretion pathway protein E [Rhizobium sp. PP-CC-3G-465]
MDLDGDEKIRDGFITYLEMNSYLSSESSQRLRTAARTSSLPLDVIVTELGLLTEDILVEHLCKFYALKRAVLPREIEIDDASIFDMEFAITSGVYPVHIDDEKVKVAVSDPTRQSLMSLLRYYFDAEVEFQITTRRALVSLLERAAGQSANVVDEPTEDALFLEQDVSRLKDIALEAPIINFVSRMAQNAFDVGATDVHIEPFADRIQIRYRRDGVLSRSDTVPKAMLAGIVTRIKILSSLNIVERRMPQDGRMRLSMRGAEIDFRVSIVPSMHGETIVLRLLRNLSVSADLQALGFDPDACRLIVRLASASHGIFVVTGPTGSGKTTTLYSLVSMLNREQVKIFTIEDPVEYQIEGVTQLQVNPGIALDFPKALRSVLRQDPDIILVGEIRDRETAQIAIQAALTGHLVLTTLHTNSAVGAITRLKDMGIEEYLIASTLRGAIAQRLVRLVCPCCDGQDAYACLDCKGTGYAGRTVIYEVLESGPGLAALLENRASEHELHEYAASLGMQDLAECAERLVKTKVTTRSEVSRVLGAGVET